MMQKSTGLSLFQIDESRHLEQHDERDTKAELYMLRLVPKAFHPAKGPHSAAKDDKKEQDLFGNAPFIMDGTVLIIGVDEEGRHIDDSKIRQKQRLVEDGSHDGLSFPRCALTNHAGGVDTGCTRLGKAASNARAVADGKEIGQLGFQVAIKFQTGTIKLDLYTVKKRIIIGRSWGNLIERVNHFNDVVQMPLWQDKAQIAGHGVQGRS